MIGITLKQLRYFSVLMKTQHFGRAADLCAISQPALSQQIKELESQLETVLFERGPKGVRPTPAAHDLLPRVRDVLGSVDGLGQVHPLGADGRPKRLRLGVIPTVAPYILPRVIACITDHAPGIDLQIREALTPILLGELEDGTVDVAMLALPAGADDLQALPIFREPFVLVRPVADAHRPVPDPAGLAREKLLLLEEGHCFRDQALDFCGIISDQTRHSLDACNLSTLVQMVDAGLGVTLIPEMASARETAAADVDVVGFDGVQPVREIGFVWRATNPLGEGYSDIAQALIAEFN